MNLKIKFITFEFSVPDYNQEENDTIAYLYAYGVRNS